MKEFIRKFFDEKFWKFLGVGVVNTCVGMGTMFLMYNVVHCNYWVSSAGNYVVGSLVSYFLNKYFTFKNTSKSPKVILRFVVNIALCYLLAYGIAKPLCLRLLNNATISVRNNVSMLVGMCLFTGLNYLGQRFFAFRSEEK